MVEIKEYDVGRRQTGARKREYTQMHLSVVDIMFKDEWQCVNRKHLLH